MSVLGFVIRLGLFFGCIALLGLMDMFLDPEGKMHQCHCRHCAH